MHGLLIYSFTHLQTWVRCRRLELGSGERSVPLETRRHHANRGGGRHGKEIGIRGSGLRRIASLLSILTALGFISLSPATGAEAPPKLTVRIFNYSPVSLETLTESENEATLILRKAGVEVEWLGCRLSAPGAPTPPACQGGLDPTSLAMRILPSVKSSPPAFRGALGFALVRDDHGPSAYASVFYDRVKELAQGGHCSRAATLGIAMAHEIGHLLLGTNGHAQQGIMRARWEREDLRKAAQRYLLFAREESAVIRAGLQARVTLQKETIIANGPSRN